MAPATPRLAGTDLMEMAQLQHDLVQPMLRDRDLLPSLDVPAPSQDVPAVQISLPMRWPLMATGTPSERERARHRQ